MKRIACLTGFLFAVIGSALAELPAGWGTNFTAALAAAKDQSQPVLAYFTASWCGPCKLMARTTLTNQAVIDALDRYRRVALDIDEQAELAAKYGIRAVPTFKLLTAGGDEVTATTGYQAADRFLPFLTNGVVEVQAAMVRQQRFRDTLAAVEKLLQQTDAASLRAAATNLMELASERDDSIEKSVKDHLTAIAKRDATVLLEGLDHPRLATRICVANVLKARLGDPFAVDVWADAPLRQQAIANWRARLAAGR